MALFYKKLSLRVGDGAPSEAAPAGDEVPSCWICHEEGADGEGKPLRRDCSCRGDTASFAHLSCLVEYAKYDSENRLKPWTTCPQCLQLYQNELAVELTTELVRFVEEQNPDDQLMFILALTVKLQLLALASQKAHQEEAKQIANKILSAIESMKLADSSLSQSASGIESEAYNALGVILYREGKEGARVAMEYLEKSQDMRKELGWDTSAVEINIAAAKLRYEGGSRKNREELIKRHQQLYTKSVSEHGEMHHETVRDGLGLGVALRIGNRSMEAEELLAKLLVTCKQLHGPDHHQTKTAEEELHKCVREP